TTNMQFCFEFVNTSCPKVIRSAAIYTVTYAVIIISTIITIVGNLEVIISIAHFKQLQTPTNYFILLLATTHFLIGLIILPYSMVRSVETCWYFGYVFCKIHSSLGMMLTTLGTSQSFCIWDCLLRNKFKGNGGLFCCNFLSWYGVLIFNKQWGLLDPVIAFFAPSLVLVGMNIKIFLVARKHSRVTGNKSNKIHSTKENNTRISCRKEHKNTKTLGIVMGVFLICWLPFFIDTIIDAYIKFTTPPVLVDAFVCNLFPE
uniref:G-protein coupled receptors family 1 profile domain-containing protein n=1 Tax=Callorhinchus milii TaxID=7868 RepID=A0A4W3HZS5_CALMI